MELSTSTNLVSFQPGRQRNNLLFCIPECARGGYRVLDLNFCEAMNPTSRLRDPDWEDYIRQIQQLGKQWGVSYRQCHLPYYDIFRQDTPDPTMENLMPNGTMSFLRGAVMLSFACGGAKFLAENGGEVENPGKTIPRAMVVSTVLVAVFYALVGFVAAGVLPLDQVAGKNISVVAKEIFPAPVYLFFVIGGAWFALLTTLNGTLSWVTRGLQRASFDGWLPASWGKENKNGAPVVLLGFFVV